MRWLSFSGMLCTATSRSRSLRVALTSDGERWEVVALEVASDAKTSNDVLDAHAHEALGVFSSFDAAKAIAEVYVRRWRAKRTKMGDTCECEDVDA